MRNGYCGDHIFNIVRATHIQLHIRQPPIFHHNVEQVSTFRHTYVNSKNISRLVFETVSNVITGFESVRLRQTHSCD
jgi:hypothetical protein